MTEPNQQTDSQRPNIILIMTDQQRYDTVAAWGHDHMITPNLDRLSAAGTSFGEAYCPGATCIASRAAMFTAMWPHTTGVYTFDRWAEHRNWVQDLADAGYWCANIGKMHFSPRDVAGGFHERVIVENPTSMNLLRGGADDDWGRWLGMHGVDRPLNRNHTDPDWIAKHQGIPWQHEEELHGDVFIGNAALTWITRHDGGHYKTEREGGRPVFLQVGFTGPHEPWDPLPRHLALYEDRELPRAVWREQELDEKPPQQARMKAFHAAATHESQIDLDGATAKEIAEMRRHYYAKITTVDEQIGRVLDALEAYGYLENSLVIFCSDHGEMLGDHNMAYKWLMYDSITHIPLIIWDNRTDRPTDRLATISDLTSLMDIGPTVLDAAGIDIPTYFEGRSLLPVLAGEEVEPHPYVFCEDNYQIMMRSTTHKLVYYIGQEAGELYTLEDDPHELFNHWDDPAYAEIKNKLQIDLLAWLAGSTYWNAGYKRTRARHTLMRWPMPDNVDLHGRASVENQFVKKW
ncbi:MAG: sulfatase-like hydrolase/transferase [Anaerolineae bacterium]|nr:sulfatase-like hydrolase/transferase [Anaerolineae bacterium]